jgi:hypothetical protein
MIKPSDVTIIVPHLGADVSQINAMQECWKSLDETAPDIDKILVTNGEKHMRYLDRKQIHLYEQGQCKAVNAAVATTNTPWIFITNDDMIYAPGWFKKLQTLGDGPYVSVDMAEGFLCISPMLIEPRPGAPTFEVMFAGGAGGDFDKNKWLKFAESHDDTPHKEILRTGFNLPFLITRELWDTIGGYDINYDPWGSNSDSDLEYKIKLAGVQPYQNCNSIVYHFSQTSGTFEPRNQSAWQKNWDYFIEKWGFPRTDEGIWEATFDIPKPPIRKFTPTWENKYA